MEAIDCGASPSVAVVGWIEKAESLSRRPTGCRGSNKEGEGGDEDALIALVLYQLSLKSGPQLANNLRIY
jgi:hypothetical protein